MRIARPVFCLAVAASLAGAGVANAAVKPKPKPVCNLVTDARGDTHVEAAPFPDDSLDIVSADVATNASKLTAVLRLKNLSASSVLQETGVSYEVSFTTSTAANPYFLAWGSDATGANAQWGDVETVQGVGNDTPKGAATAVIDKAKNEIRITAALSDLSSLGKFKAGSKVSSITAKAWALVGTPQVTPATPVVGPGNGLLEEIDIAEGAKPYIVGSPSCVKVGA